MLPAAIGVAISPIPIVAVILMLMSNRAAVNGVAFLVGWILALGAVGVIVLNIGITSGDSVNTAAEWGKLAIGALFLLMAASNWRKRPKPGQKPAMPKWMQAIDRVKWPVAFGLAILLAGLNPKNLGLALAGVASIAEANLPTNDQYILLAIFIGISSLSLLLPLLFFFVGGKRAKALLLKLKAWLARYNAIIMAIILLILGAKIALQAVLELF